MNAQHPQSTDEHRDRLVQFESEWNSGRVPDVAVYLRDVGENDNQFIEDLIEFDLECRWQQFQSDSDPSGRDRHGFPNFPLVEDYAALLPERLRRLIFTPHCVAEEYRVRFRWGDQPTRESILERFSSDKTEIEAALDAVDTELEIEGIKVTEQSSLSHADAARPTVILGQSPQKESKLVPEEKLKGTRVGKYELETRLGHGGFGEVWKAHDPDLKRDVAIKFPRLDKHFPPELLDTFRTEAQKLASLGRIQGVVNVFDCGIHNGKPYFVADFIEGNSLAVRMQREKLTHEESAALIAKLAETLKRAHQEKLVHRDIKPANILLDKEGEPYLADFGMAATDEEQLSEQGGILGTIAYMAPEQARGDSQRVDGRADIYALGVILYCLLTNELPYGGKDIQQYLDNIQHQKPRPPRQIDDTIPPELERICLKCLKKDEDERYLSAGELATAMRAWDETTSKRVGLKSTAFAVLCLSLIFFAWKLWPDKPEKTPGKPPVPSLKTPPGTYDLLMNMDKPQSFMRGVVFDGDLAQREDGKLVVRTRFPSIFKLGDRGGDTFEYRLRLYFPLNGGEFGIVWGMSESNGERSARVLRFEHPQKTDSRVKIDFVASRILSDGVEWTPQGGQVADTTNIPASAIGSTVEIIIGVKNRVIRYAFIDEQPITFFASLPDDVVSAESAGTLGVYSANRCELHVKQATFSLFSEERENKWKTSIQNK